LPDALAEPAVSFLARPRIGSAGQHLPEQAYHLGDIGIADAREAVRAARVGIRAGVDPVAQRREARRVALTFD
jgi:integrase